MRIGELPVMTRLLVRVPASREVRLERCRFGLADDALSPSLDLRMPAAEHHDVMTTPSLDDEVAASLKAEARGHARAKAGGS